MNNYNKLSDKELFEFFKGSEEERKAAFAVIYDRHSRNVYAYCLKVTGNSDEADDVFQEVFMRFYKHAPGYTYNNVNSLLIKIARNLCLNLKRNKKNNVDLENINLVAPDVHKFENAEMQKLVAVAIDMLEPEYKEPLVLKMYNGLKYEEIAEILDLNVVSARTRVFRAKQKIKKYLKPYIEEIYT